MNTGGRTTKHGALIMLAILSFFFQSYYVEVGFSLKAFFIVIPIGWVIVGKLKLPNSLPFAEQVFLLFLVLYLSTGIYSYDHESSLRFLLGALLLIAVYFMARSVFGKISLDDLVPIIIKAGIIFNLVSSALYAWGLYEGGLSGLFQDLTAIRGVMYDRGIPRLIGPVKDPNFFVMYNSIFLFAALAFFEKRQCKILFFWSSVNMVLTFSRGGMASLITGLIMFLLVSGVHSKVGLRIFIQIFLSTLASIGIAFSVLPEFQDFLIKRLDSISSGSGRFEIWENGIKVFLDNPYGGIGAFSFLAYNINNFGGEHYMHNTFLEVLVEGGIFVFLLYLIFWVSLILSCYRNISRMDTTRSKQLSIGLLSTLTVIFISFISISAVINEFFFLVFALIMRCYSQRRAKTGASAA